MRNITSFYPLECQVTRSSSPSELKFFKFVKIEAKHFHSLLIDDTFHLESTPLKINKTVGEAVTVWGNITGVSCYSVGQAVTTLCNVTGASCDISQLVTIILSQLAPTQLASVIGSFSENMCSE